MSTDEVIFELQQKIIALETALENVSENSRIWDRIFSENYWGMVITDVISGEFIKMNSCYAEMHGYSILELIGKSIYDVFAPEYQKDLPEILRRIHEDGHFAFNSVHVKKDGSCFPVHIDSFEVAINKRCLRFVSTWDITESELKEKKLRQYRESLEELIDLRTDELVRTNEQLQSEILKKEATEKELAIANQEMSNILGSISDGFIAVNRQWIITYANQAMVEAREANGMKGNLIGSNFWEIFQQGNMVINDACQKVMNDGQPTRFEAFAPQMGQWAEISIYSTEIGIALFCRNIQEKINIERAMEEEHRRLYSLFDAFPGLICILEKDFKIRFANSSFHDKFGPWEGKLCHEVMAGLTIPCSDCVAPMVFRDSSTLWKERFYDNRIYEIYARPFTDVDGSGLVFEVLMDITDRKNTEREFARSERLNMVGEMAAGIAHEVRNPLTTVRGFLQLLASKDNVKQYGEYFDLMIEELDRANFIITDFLNLAGDKSSDFKLTNISNIVRSLAPLLSADALMQDKEICLELERVADIQGDENELRQLLLNLARNGFESMQGGTALTIQTRQLENETILRVCDQGGGIDPLIFDRLGTPFLTTKERGTGLGVAICKSIVARHNAVINFESNSTGTIVTMKFVAG